ncbi:MAG: DNA polymerase III subunit delta [Flavobacteriales bacterium]
MKAEEILQNIKSKNIAPVYLLTGEESFFIDQISDFLEDKVIDESQKDFDLQIFYGKDSNVLDILSSVKQYPLLGDKRLVILREAQQLKGFEKLGEYLEQPSQQTVFVICYRDKKIDKRSSLYKKKSKEVLFFQSDKLYENQTLQWAEKFITRKKRHISPKALQLLIEKTGTELTLVYNELNKLLLNVKEGEKITSNIISEQIGILKDFNLFELQQALGTRNALKCQLIVKHFSKNPKNHPLVVTLGFLYGYFCKLIILNGLKSPNDQDIAKTLGVHPFFVKEYRAAIHFYDLRKCVAILSFLREADVKSKGFTNVSLNDENLLKELIFKIIHI